MNYVDYAAIVLDLVLRATNRHIKTKVLSLEHLEPAAVLLSREFCKNEPLCRVLGLNEADVLPFFRDQVRHIAQQGLGIVAVDRGGALQGVLTVEDHMQQFEPPEEGLPEGLSIIGAYLESMQVPDHFLPKKAGEVCYIGLASVAKGRRNRQVLSMMMLASHRMLPPLGYVRGYAKVTNPGIIKRFQRLERIARGPVFISVLTAKPKDFVYKGYRPFADYDGETSVFTWTALGAGRSAK